MGQCCSGGTGKEWDDAVLRPIVKNVIRELSKEAEKGSASDRRRKLDGSAKVVALSLHREYPDVGWGDILRVCKEAGKTTEMEPHLEKLTARSLAGCKTESQSEIRMVASWIRGDPNGDGSMSSKELANAFKQLNMPAAGSRLTELLKRHDTNGDKSLTFAEYRTLWQEIDTYPDIESIFYRFTRDGAKIMTPRELERFLNTEQHNEATEDILERHGVREDGDRYEGISLEGFTEYLLDTQLNALLDASKIQKPYQDMTLPLHHYYIASSHNTYLTKGQLVGESSCDMYKNALIWGCRCVELDCWDGPDGEPVIYHGYTRTTKILFSDVIETINQHAFATSLYPVILSLEVHTSLKQQERMAQHMKKIFKTALFTGDGDTATQTPESLKRKILIKGKTGDMSVQTTPDGEQYWGDESDDEKNEEIEEARKQDPNSRKGVHPSLSALVYLASVKMTADRISGEAGQRQQQTHIASMPEGKVDELYTKTPQDLTDMNMHMMTRVYPAGFRVNSANYNPQPAWNMGCQVVALNYQTQSSEELRLNIGRFQDNGGCGYLLKPVQLRENGHNWTDAKPASLSVSVLRAWNLPKPQQRHKGEVVDPFVTLKISGLRDDEKSSRSRVVKNNGFNPTWDFKETFSLASVEMSTLIIQIRDDGGDILGEAVLPAQCILEGFRTVALKDSMMRDTNSGVLVRCRWDGHHTAVTPPRKSSSRRKVRKDVEGAAAGHTFLLGQQVVAQWGGDQWVARIAGREPNNTCVVLFEDGSRCSLPSSDIKPAPVNNDTPYHFGQSVLAAWGNDGWFPAIISHVNEDSSCAVEWADNSGWNTIPLQYVKAS